jgi:phosphoribosylanthranilate isomerase
MREIKIKICGLKYPSNIAEVVNLKPDYMGFIMFGDSPRYVSLKDCRRLVKNVPASILKVGVIVNETLEKALEIARSGIFDFLQLHGNETIEYCRFLSGDIRIIKVFHISDHLPESISDYQSCCDMFLFDTAGKRYGGTGKRFDHSILSTYPYDTDFILSGGISAGDSEEINSGLNRKMIAVDLNSMFEKEPGVKDIDLLKKFIDKI